jgi:sulfide:quinone oxidoreductase
MPARAFPTAPRRVLVAGAGAGGLDTALALRALAPAVVVRMIAPDRHVTCRPRSKPVPGGADGAARVELAHVAEEQGFELVRDAVARVEPGARRVVTQEGGEWGYDVLVLAVGGRPGESVAGALAFRGRRDMDRVSAALEDARGLPSPRIILTAGARVRWTLPLYELALQVAAWAQRAGTDAEVVVVTAEPQPVAAFGPFAGAAVRRLLSDRGIALHTGCEPRVAERRRLWIEPGGDLAADLVIALPGAAGPALAGVPHDEAGFAPVDGRLCVRGLRDVYAIGDMTVHEHAPGGPAAPQADVAARCIAAWAGEPVIAQEYVPALSALLHSGGDPLYLATHPELTIAAA